MCIYYLPNKNIIDNKMPYVFEKWYGSRVRPQYKVYPVYLFF